MASVAGEFFRRTFSIAPANQIYARDAFTKREAAAEELYIRQEEKEK